MIIPALSGCASAPGAPPASPRGGMEGGPSRTISPVAISFPAALRGYFTWPVRGEVISPFGSKVGRVVNKGIDIQAGEGADVRAARAGRVVYCDSHFKGFGKTVILDHGDKYQTVYAYNSDILVKVGDAVERNSIIAKAGRTGRARESMLHFEIRKDGEPQNPFYYLSL